MLNKCLCSLRNKNMKTKTKILGACAQVGDKDKNDDKRYCVPALISEKEAPHSTPGSLDPLRCSTPKISSWYFLVVVE